MSTLEQLQKLERQYKINKTVLRQLNSTGQYIEWSELAPKLLDQAVEIRNLKKELGVL